MVRSGSRLGSTSTFLVGGGEWVVETRPVFERPRGAHIGGLMTSRYGYVTVYVRNSVPYVTLRFGSRVVTRNATTLVSRLHCGRGGVPV